MRASSYDKLGTVDVDLSHMSEEEVLLFESVLNRNDAINTMEINRIRRLKSLASAQEATGPCPTQQRAPFPRLLCQKCGSLCLPTGVAHGKPTTSRTTLCRVCRCLLCRACWGASPENRLKVCGRCYQKVVLDAKTGKWFHQQMKKRLSVQGMVESEPITPDHHHQAAAHGRHSPKRNILRRLRSYNSVHEELDDCDERLDDQLRRSRNNLCTDDQSYYCDSPDGDQGRGDDWNPIGNNNYYRPLSHINANPLKSSSNGSPISVDEANVDRWKVPPSEDGRENIILPLIAEPGEVLIELDFNFRMSQFIVILRQCRNLPVADPSTKSICPYLFILLLPDRSKKSRRTTSVKKNSFCPTYDQIFKYSINFTELETRSLLVMLCHKDDHSTRDLALGQVIIPLSFMDFGKPIVRWYCFQQLGQLPQSRYERSLSNVQPRRSNIPPYFGEISLALKYVSRQCINVTSISQTESVGELHVWIKSMRNIATHQWTSSPSVPSARRFSIMEGKQTEDGPAMNGLSFSSNRLINAVTQLGQNQPVARVCLLPYRTNIQNTQPARSQSDNGIQFIWSSILKFPNIDLEELRTRSMEVTVWVNSRHGWLDKIIQSKCMGGVRLSKGSGMTDLSTASSRGVSTGLIEERMWNAMLERSNTWVDGTIKLKMEASFLTQPGMQ